ncbi:MAG: arsenite efflux transporter metallochaperone ArsD [Polyangiales bacterium]
MKTIQVFDPAMCCASGVCGPSVDPILARFSADLEWLRAQGLRVERFNLSSEPAAFVGNEAVKAALQRDGNGCLPMIVCDGEVISKGRYPTRATLASRVGLDVSTVTAPSCCAPSKPGATGSGCC